MIKKVFGRKLSRGRPAREALFSTLVASLIRVGKIKTTKAKAKAIQGEAEKMITLAKKGTLSARRMVLSRLDNSKEAAHTLFHKVVGAFANRNSGYTRITPSLSRKGDNAQMVTLAWTEKVEYESKIKSKPEKKEKE
ncbi:MAG: 50S ribosomal protein L17 [bacterium]|nr:50S ribosomal protein L17 [bacterium]